MLGFGESLSSDYVSEDEELRLEVADEVPDDSSGNCPTLLILALAFPPCLDTFFSGSFPLMISSIVLTRSS